MIRTFSHLSSGFRVDLHGFHGFYIRVPRVGEMCLDLRAHVSSHWGIERGHGEITVHAGKAMLAINR